MADAKEVEARKFVKQGSESIKTDYGTFDTIKVVMKHELRTPLRRTKAPTKIRAIDSRKRIVATIRTGLNIYRPITHPKR